MDPIWESLYSDREWGKYPAEDLIRSVMRTYKGQTLSEIKVLEIGCGAGANLSFFLNEGFCTYGIDGSPSAIERANKRLREFKRRNEPNLVVGDFTKLPWGDNYFDIVVDYLAMYANTRADITKTMNECLRVLRPGGYMYSRSWAIGCTGYDTGEMIEEGTSSNPTNGPCSNMGISHFFSESEILNYFSDFSEPNIRKSTVEGLDDGQKIIEWLVWAKK